MFSDEQFASVRNLPRIFTVNVLAAATNTTVSDWLRLMDAQGGATIYQRKQVLNFMSRQYRKETK